MNQTTDSQKTRLREALKSKALSEDFASIFDEGMLAIDSRLSGLEGFQVLSTTFFEVPCVSFL